MEFEPDCKMIDNVPVSDIKRCYSLDNNIKIDGRAQKGKYHSYVITNNGRKYLSLFCISCKNFLLFYVTPYAQFSHIINFKKYVKHIHHTINAFVFHSCSFIHHSFAYVYYNNN